MHAVRWAALAHVGELARGQTCAETRHKHAADTADIRRERGGRGRPRATHLNIAACRLSAGRQAAAADRAARAGARARAWSDLGDLGLYRYVRATKDTMVPPAWHARASDAVVLHLHMLAHRERARRRVSSTAQQPVGGSRRVHEGGAPSHDVRGAPNDAGERPTGHTGVLGRGGRSSSRAVRPHDNGRTARGAAARLWHRHSVVRPRTPPRF